MASMIASLLIVCGGGSGILLFQWSGWVLFAYIKATIIYCLIATLLGYRYTEGLRRQIKTSEVTSGKHESLIKSLFPDIHERLYDGSKVSQVYTDTTVLFADIVGFSSWASERSHEQVFTLLEELFGRFDKVARELKGTCPNAVRGRHSSNSQLQSSR